MKKIEIKEIPNLPYEGYLWYSDKERPVLIDSNRKFSLEDLTNHPFVVEGALYAVTGNISISIRWIGDSYLIHQANCDDFSKEVYKISKHQWLMNKDAGRKIKMEEIWKLEQDEQGLCAGMPSFRPAFWVFKGFK